MPTIWFKIATLFMMLGVILGAFGAHALKGRLLPESLEIYKTAVFYQFIHAIGIFVVWFAGIRAGGSSRVLTISGWLGAFTPLGGLAFILGWALLLFC